MAEPVHQHRVGLVLRVAALTGCRYELAQHVDIAREAGVSDATMRAVIEQDGQLTEAERLLVACADAVIESGAIEEPLWRDLAVAYEERVWDSNGTHNRVIRMPSGPAVVPCITLKRASVDKPPDTSRRATSTSG